MILGLVAHYDLTGDRSSLDAACRELDCLINELKQKKKRLVDLVAYWNGLPPSVAIESGALLYQRTGITRYRDFSESIAAQWNEPGTSAPKGLRLVDDALEKEMLTDVVSRHSDLDHLAMGLLSPEAIASLAKAVGIGESYGVALRCRDRLLGATILVMPPCPFLRATLLTFPFRRAWPHNTIQPGHEPSRLSRP